MDYTVNSRIFPYKYSSLSVTFRDKTYICKNSNQNFHFLS